jgi:proteasome lid subunit RPN8/RPN11
VGTVTQAYVPRQKPIKSEEGVGYFVTGETLFQLNKDLAETGLRLIAQVHSHPMEAYHSDADDRYAIMTAQGDLSVVVPDFGHCDADPNCWAVYRLNGAEWTEQSAAQVKALFDVVGVT